MSPAHFPSGALVCITEGTETPTEGTEAKRRTRRVGFTRLHRLLLLRRHESATAAEHHW
jgi:hypothetical protein